MIVFRVRRRKPQNLTPPGSSDGGSSAGSGQSPSSVHPGSPPSTIEAPPLKRPGYYSGADGLPTKRPRIAHSSRKPDDVSSVQTLLWLSNCSIICSQMEFSCVNCSSQGRTQWGDMEMYPPKILGTNF